MTAPDPGKPDLKVAGLEVWVHGRQFPGAEDYDDGNWLRVTAHCGASRASVRVQGAILMVTDIAGFGDRCGAMLRGNASTAALDPIEPELKVSLDASDRLGHIRVLVEITPDNVTQSHEMEFEIDQSHLPEIVRQCSAIVREYPVRGLPYRIGGSQRPSGLKGDSGRIGPSPRPPRSMVSASPARRTMRHFVYESRRDRLIPPRYFLRRLAAHVAVASGVVVVSLALGMAGYAHFEGLSWRDAFLNAAVLLGGMGPVDVPRTDGGKLFAGVYALYSGLVFLVAIAIVLAPAFHRILHRFHWDEE